MLLILVVVGIFLRVNRYLHGFPFWGDEAWVALDVCKRSFQEIFSNANIDSTLPVRPAGFMLAEKLLVELFGTRELVFLGYKYLVVVDRVAPGPGAQHRWTLHVAREPKIEGALVTADHEPGRLFCRTLLPESPRIVKTGGPEKPLVHLNQKGEETFFPMKVR